jgi:hypothetical protein
MQLNLTEKKEKLDINIGYMSMFSESFTILNGNI